MHSLRKHLKNKEKAARKTMTAATLLVKGRSLPLTPKDTGNLRQSAYTKMRVEGSRIIGEIGYTANYAVYVHEIAKRYKVGDWKYLETALKMSKDELIALFTGKLRPA